MKSTNRIRADSVALHLILLAISAFCIAYFLFLIVTVRDWNSPALDWRNIYVCVLCFPLSVFAIYRLIHGVYFTDLGVECCRFGQVYRQIPWNQVAEVCITRSFPISMGGSTTKRIVIVPNGCEKFTSEGLIIPIYMNLHRNQAVWIDDSDRNRQFIAAHYGEIVDLSNK